MVQHHNFQMQVRELIDAARPFLSPDNVDETSGTIPLLDRLEKAINNTERHLKQRLPVVGRLPDDFEIPKLRGGYYVYAEENGVREFLQTDGSWGPGCEKVFETEILAYEFVWDTLGTTPVSPRTSE